MIEIIVGTIIVVLFYKNMRKNQQKRAQQYYETEQQFRNINDRLYDMRNDRLNDR